MAQNLKINILAQDKTRQAFNGIRGKLAGLRSAVFNLRTAFGNEVLTNAISYTGIPVCFFVIFFRYRCCSLT